MMRNRMRWVYRRPRLEEPDGYGGQAVRYLPPEPLFMGIQPAGGKILAQTYGQRLAYLCKGFLWSPEEIKEMDGVCLFVYYDEAPDYQVIAIQSYHRHRELLLERIHP